MERVDMIKCLVRPICVIYSMVMISILALMGMNGHSMPVDGVAADCVYALIGITGFVTAEWTGERGVKSLVTLIKELRSRSTNA